ncbi:uncharacterized protein LOC133838219 [Drosophila sulfurigaster albostrigata]|uniref:uncharacterized protein LOC133838219 n=1 Tax=Drosophila sulfurigaster albostrigata TaxID=89887 RepID=UPI002D21B2A7|nr:uncharacterized protein LOC133838219 [Drosophila sulfurigaster albostrigata]
MKFLLIVVFCGVAAVVNASPNSLLSRLLHRQTTTTTTTTTAAPRQEIFTNNNVPEVPAGCIAHYACSKKLTTVPNPRPCLKYCLKRIECPDKPVQRGKANECVEVDATKVLADYESTTVSSNDVDATTQKIMEVAMIDFPCQPGYLPDSRGRCREIW